LRERLKFIIFILGMVGGLSLACFGSEEKSPEHPAVASANIPFLHPVPESLVVGGTTVRKEDILVLSIDGGGIRGILPATLLNWLEREIHQEINQAHPNAPETAFRIAESFHVFAGTSTGGLIVLGMNVPDQQTRRPLYPLQEFVDLYTKESTSIFPKKGMFSGALGAKFKSEGLKEVLERYFQNLTMQDLLKPTFVPVYDIHQEGLLVFSKLEAGRKKGTYYLKDVALATSAAPTYFPAAVIRDQQSAGEVVGIDGGVIANNPAEIAYLSARELYPEARIHVISLGCGAAPLLTLQNMREGGKIQWARDISSLLLESSSAMTHQNMARLTRLRGDFYTRIQFKLDQKVADLDNSNPEFIQLLTGYARREIEDPHSPIHAIKETLKAFYRVRNNYIFFNLIDKVNSQLRSSPHTLDLSSQHLEGRGLWEISHFLGSAICPYPIAGIQKLDLSGNVLISPYVGQLKGFDGLEFLALRDTELMEEGLRELRQLELRHLRELDLRGNQPLLHLEGYVLWPYVEFYQKQGASIKLDEEAFYKLGQFRKGTRSFAEAIIFHRQGEAALNRMALAEILMIAQLPDDLKDFKGGYRIYQDLAASGHAEAQYRIAHLLCKPDGEALRHLQALGEIRVDGEAEGRQEALQKGVIQYQRAADQGHKRAANALAKLYYDWDARNNSCVITVQAPIPEKGFRDERYQLEAALKYYKIAQQGGSESASRAITRIEQELEKIRNVAGAARR
jgi:patatin-like phospholipase/acyl hydrolase